MRRSIAAPLVVALTLAFLSGCSGTYGAAIQKEQKDQLVKGKTTKVEVLRAMGDPSQTIDLGGGMEELEYVSGFVSPLPPVGDDRKNTEFWVTLKDGLVQDFGERKTLKPVPVK